MEWRFWVLYQGQNRAVAEFILLSIRTFQSCGLRWWIGNVGKKDNRTLRRLS